MKYLIADTDTIRVVEWKNPRVIDTFWFGDSPTNSFLASTVFPESARPRLEEWIRLVNKAKQAKDDALGFLIETANMKTRGEFD